MSAARCQGTPIRAAVESIATERNLICEFHVVPRKRRVSQKRDVPWLTRGRPFAGPNDHSVAR